MTQNMTEEQAKKVVGEFARWMDDNAITQQTAAKLIDMSAAVVSQVRAGKYRGDTIGVAVAMHDMLMRRKRRAESPQRPGFANTRTARAIRRAIRDAHDHAWSVMVIGNRGLGKTATARHYAERTPGCILVTAAPSCGSRSMIGQIADAIDVAHTHKRNVHEITLECIQALRGTEMLLVVDECDFLPERAMQDIRHMVEMAGIGAVYLATPAFKRWLDRSATETICQFLDRIAYCLELDGITLADARSILAPYKLDDTAIAAAHRGCDGSARRLAHATVLAHKLAAAKAVAAEHFDGAYGQLLQPTAVKIRSPHTRV